MFEKAKKRCKWVTAAAAATALGLVLAQDARAAGGGGAGEAGTSTHQHLDSRFAHNRYYYDRGYAVHAPPAGGVANLIGRNGERYYFQGGDWYRWWGGAWIVVDAPVGMLVPSLPPHSTTIWRSGTPYYYANETYYVWDGKRNEYEVVAPPEIQSGRREFSAGLSQRTQKFDQRVLILRAEAIEPLALILCFTAVPQDGIA